MKIEFHINEEYRKEQFVEGHELADFYQLELDIKELSEQDRQFLLDVFANYDKVADQRGSEPKGIYQTFRLNFPYFRDNEVQFDSEWHARVNPLNSSPVEIFHAWKKIYQSESAKAEREYNKH